MGAMEPTYARPSDPTEGPLTFHELALATRNRGMPLERVQPVDGPWNWQGMGNMGQQVPVTVR
jgi:hypothetical protein